MLGSALKTLAMANEVAKLDLSPNALVLNPSEHNQTVTAWYQGSYVSCLVAATGFIDASCAVAIGDFATIVKLFDDEEDVFLNVQRTGLILSSTRRRMTLRFDTRVMSREPNLEPDRLAVRMNVSDVRREANIAIGVAATSMSTPILCGVRLVASQALQKIAFQAADGTALVYEYSMPAQVLGELEVIVPAKDFVTALTVMGEAECSIGMIGNSLFLGSSIASVRIPVLQGKWPDFSPVRKMNYQDVGYIIPADSIRACAAAARIYKVSTDCILMPSPEGLKLASIPGEAGQFEELIKSELTFDRTVAFDVSDLEQAARMAGTESVEIRLSDTMALAQFMGRRLYINQRSAIE